MMPLREELGLTKAFGWIMVVAIGAMIVWSGTTGCGGGGGSSGTGTNGTTCGGAVTYPSGNLVGRVISTVTSGGCTVPIPNVLVQFFDVSGVVVASATTGANGTFGVQVGTNVDSLHLVSSSIPGDHYKAYTFNGEGYSALIADCRAPVPPYDVNGRTILPIIQVYHNSSVPPPPSGCGP
jgi:hypothetical protein